MIRRQWGEDGMYKSAHGEWVLHSEAQEKIDELKSDLERSRRQSLVDLAKIDALKAQRDELLGVLQMVADGCGVLDISERGQLYEAIAKARGDL